MKKSGYWVSFFGALLMSSAAVAQSQDQATGIGDYPAISLLLDASGSMRTNDISDGTQHWWAAKDLSTRVLKALPRYPNKQHAFAYFGADQTKAGDCDLYLGQSIGPNSPDRAQGSINALNGIEEVDGKTLLARGLKLAWQQLEDTGGAVVIITGLEKDNCGGDPCAMYRGLQNSRDPGKPPIDVRYVVSIGTLGFEFIKRELKCLGGEVLQINTKQDIEPAARKITGLLKTPAVQKPTSPPEDPKLSLVATLNSPRGIASSLPRVTALIQQSGQLDIPVRPGSDTKVALADVSVKAIAPQAPGLETPKLMVAPDLTTRVELFYTPPKVLLRLPAALGTSETKWELKNTSTGQVLYLQGKKIERFLVPGEYDVSVWSGEAYLTGSFTAEWNSIVQKTIVN